MVGAAAGAGAGVADLFGRPAMYCTKDICATDLEYKSGVYG